MTSNFSIRSAVPADMSDIFELANDEVVRINSFNTNKILWAEHQEWFAQMLSSDSCVFYCVIAEDGALAGVVYFNLNSQAEWYISIRINAVYRGIGLGSWAIKTCSDMVKEAKDSSVTAYIKHGNTPSIKSFTKAGYKILPDCTMNGTECHKMIYL